MYVQCTMYVYTTVHTHVHIHIHVLYMYSVHVHVYTIVWCAWLFTTWRVCYLWQRDIYNNAALLVELCVAKLSKDWFVLLELLALVLNPQSRWGGAAPVIKSRYILYSHHIMVANGMHCLLLTCAMSYMYCVYTCTLYMYGSCMITWAQFVIYVYLLALLQVAQL